MGCYTLHTTHVPPYNPQYLPTTHIPPHNLTSTFPAMINHPIPPHLLPPHKRRRRHPFTDFIANTPFLPSGNPSRWTATPAKPTLMNTSKYTSPMSPCTRPKMQSSAKPFSQPSRALLWNGSQHFLLTPSTTSTFFHTCSPPILLAAVHTKLPQSPSWPLDRNKANHLERS